MVPYEWDAEKNSINQKKHGICFEEAVELFESEGDYLEIFDVANSINEERFISIGQIKKGVVLVVWTERTDDIVRIISARWATKREKNLYCRHMEKQ